MTADALWWSTIRVTSSSAARCSRWLGDGFQKCRADRAGTRVGQVEPAGRFQQSLFAKQLSRRIGGLGKSVGVKNDADRRGPASTSNVW